MMRKCYDTQYRVKALQRTTGYTKVSLLWRQWLGPLYGCGDRRGVGIDISVAQQGGREKGQQKAPAAGTTQRCFAQLHNIASVF